MHRLADMSIMGKLGPCWGSMCFLGREWSPMLVAIFGIRGCNPCCNNWIYVKLLPLGFQVARLDFKTFYSSN